LLYLKKGRKKASKIMRVFVAIPLPEEVKEQLAHLQKKLKVACPSGGVKWVGSENFHITVFFVGEVFEEAVEKIKEFLLERSQKLFKTSLQIKGVGYFGKESAPRVLWVGMSGELQQFAELASDIKHFTDSLNLKTDEKPFSAHITLCRINNPASGRELIKKIKDFEKYETASFIANRIVLMESVLSSAGPTYTAIGEFAF
jgi:2'-5' RNA ligase